MWVQGCSLRCVDCIAPETWSKKDGNLIETHDLAKTILSNREIEGVTITGGEPTEQASAVADLLTYIKSAEKNTWVYTGHTLEELVARNDPEMDRMLVFTDILVDGPYQKVNAGIHAYRGSSNQRIIPLHGNGPPIPYSQKNRLEITLDSENRMVIVGIPPPGFLKNLENNLSRRSVRVDYINKNAKTNKTNSP